MPAVKVYGDPAPKGSMKCVGQRGRHQLVEDNKRTKPWRNKVKAAGATLLATLEEPLTGPVIVDVTVTLPRPATVPLAKREWPIVAQGAGDADKHLRTILDGLTDSGLWKDDAIVVAATIWKCYPDTPGCPDRLDEPGAIIRVAPLT